jgi:hypothetical protein
MSNTINLVLPFNDKNVELVKGLLAKADLSKKVNEIEVTDAEEVGETTPAKTPAKRASRAKPKPAPEPEDEDEDEDEDLDDDLGEEETDDAEITEDDLRELSAKKIGKHKDAIIAQLGKYKVKGWANLPEKHYQAMHDFLTKLK